MLADLGGRIGLRESQAEFSHVVRSAAALKWTRDPLDRLIVGNAIAEGAPLFTADATLRKHYKRARWG